MTTCNKKDNSLTSHSTATCEFSIVSFASEAHFSLSRLGSYASKSKLTETKLPSFWKGPVFLPSFFNLSFTSLILALTSSVLLPLCFYSIIILFNKRFKHFANKIRERTIWCFTCISNRPTRWSLSWHHFRFMVLQ